MLKKFFTVLFLFGIFVSQRADAAHTYPEKYYQNEWCSRWRGRAEYLLADKTRVDCVTETYAVEFDFAPKWAEAVGQSLYYSKMTGKKAAIVLIIEDESDFKYYARAKMLADDNNITLWYMKKPQSASGKARGAIDGGEIYLSLHEIERLIKNIYKLVEGLL